MPWDEAACVFDAEAALHEGFEQIAALRHGGGERGQARQEAAAAALSRLAGQALLRPYVDLTTASLMDDSAAALEIKRATCSRALAFSASREIVFSDACEVVIAE